MGGKAKGKTSGTEGAAPTASNPAEDALNSVLDGLDTPEEKLAALSAKFLELHKDLRRTRGVATRPRVRLAWRSSRGTPRGRS